MTTRTVTAMFRTRDEAERAGQMLVNDLRIDRSMIRTSPGAGVTDEGYDQTRPYDEKGFFASLKDLFVPDEDRYGYAEGLRRGNVLLTAQIEQEEVSRASDILEQAGAIDLNAQEASWRQTGWTDYDATAHNQFRSTVPAGASSVRGGQDDTVKVVEERLVVGKRDIENGRVRVRTYVVERPVEEQVTLHEERVTIERRPVDRAVTAEDEAAFQERTIEARAMSEEAVVGKEARIVEEIAVHKDVADRVETVRDTVRKTEVEIEDNSAAARAGAASVRGGVGTTESAAGTARDAGGAMDRTLNTNVSGTNPSANAPDGTPGNPKGTMASRAVDETLGTNISGANPGADAPDGTPGNPKGTMASRAVHQTLGTNISGTNPGRK